MNKGDQPLLQYKPHIFIPRRTRTLLGFQTCAALEGFIIQTLQELLLTWGVGTTNPLGKASRPADTRDDVYALGITLLQLFAREEESLHIVNEARNARDNRSKRHLLHWRLLEGERGCSETNAQELTKIALQCVEEPLCLKETIQRLRALRDAWKFCILYGIFQIALICLDLLLSCF